MKEPVFIFVPGIRTNPLNSWPMRAIAWIHRETGARARALPYYARATTRRLRQGERVKALADMLAEYAAEEREIILVAHSNGADIVCRAAQQSRLTAHTIHFIAPAAEADFEENGLADTFRYGCLQRVFVWYDSRDRALRLGRWTRRLFGWMGLGYGSMGLTGPVISADDSWTASVSADDRPGMGHSGWFEEPFFSHGLMPVIAAGHRRNIQTPNTEEPHEVV